MVSKAHQEILSLDLTLNLRPTLHGHFCVH